MNWFFLTLISVVIVSLGNILQKKLMSNEKSDPFAYAVVFHFLLATFNFLIALTQGFSVPTANEMPLYILAATLWGVGTVFLFKALQLIESSEVTIITSSRALITIVASVLFLNERFDATKIIGTALIFTSLFLVTKLKAGLKFNSGVLYAIGMAIFYGLAVVIDSVNLQGINPLSYLAITNILISVMLFVAQPKIVSRMTFIKDGAFAQKMLVLTVFYSLQAIAYYYALKIGPASQIAAINQAQVIVTVLFAMIFLKEKSNLGRKFLAAVLVSIGVLLMR